ncbi:DMT family transporter [Streptomyces misionensis]|uniref:DMT family transporter n=1 Tax=Streptomyces misionensis TaxID=67331 RepID=UPI0016489903|nr:DMT family transporter [Streptomyces misionensis]
MSGTLSAGVLAAVLTAAVLHAVWNSMAHRIPDKLIGFTLISLACTGCAAVLVCCTPLPPAGAWPFLAASAALQVSSQLFLLRAYELGDFGQMYPLARGVAPLLVAIASVTLLGGALSPVQAVGVLLVSGGLAALALASGRIGRAQLPALGAALGSGAIIAAYTLVGHHRGGDPRRRGPVRPAPAGTPARGPAGGGGPPRLPRTSVRTERSVRQHAPRRRPAVDLLLARRGGPPADAYPDPTVHDVSSCRHR